MATDPKDSKAAPAAPKPSNFLRGIIERDLEAGTLLALVVAVPSLRWFPRASLQVAR